jgi:hypothetical protein
MSRYYVIVGIEAPGYSKQATADLVTSMLRLSNTDHDTRVIVSDAVALTDEDVETIIYASESYIERGKKRSRQLESKLQQLREAVDRALAARKESP